MLFFVFTLSSCSKGSLDDFREEGKGVVREMVAELRLIRSRDDLPAHADRLQELFNRLVDVMVRARQYKVEHPYETFTTEESGELPDSDVLRTELNRILHMEGGYEVIERAQEPGLHRLEALESAM